MDGVIRASAVVFFAYIGFDAVSTAAGEAKNPQRDMPIGILGSLVFCTVLYIAMCAVLTGMFDFRLLGTAEPVSTALDYYPSLGWLQTDRKRTSLNSRHSCATRLPSSAGKNKNTN